MNNPANAARKAHAAAVRAYRLERQRNAAAAAAAAPAGSVTIRFTGMITLPALPEGTSVYAALVSALTEDAARTGKLCDGEMDCYIERFALRVVAVDPK